MKSIANHPTPQIDPPNIRFEPVLYRFNTYTLQKVVIASKGLILAN